MEITRLQPFPLMFIQDGFDSDTDYVLCILDDHSGDLYEIPVTSDEDGQISTPLPNYFSRYDDEYRGEIYVSEGLDPETGHTILGDLVWIDTITIMRPYVDPDILAETEEDQEDAKVYEAVARAIINSITGGFTFKRETVETVGLGNDYLAVPFRLNKIIKVYENDILVYDADPSDPDWTNVKEYYITPDRGSISVKLNGTTGYNRLQSKPIITRSGASDSFTRYNTNDSPNFSEGLPYSTKTFSDTGGGSPMFPSGWDYVVIVEAGWPIIPQDIKQATMLIVNDLKCNNIPYINSYIKDYKSDQFDLKFDDRVFRDTGNRIADKILSAYVRPIYRLGVL